MNAYPPVLDPCCGSRMMWFDRQDPRAIFGDRRSETLTVTDNSRGNVSGTRTIRIEPDTLMDFRALPYPDGAFKLVAFDPPHLVHAGPRSWLAAKYGRLSDNWRDDIRAGFSECFRVLESEGVLVFKWNETQVKLSEVLALTPHAPLFGNTSGKKAGTHWMVFMKPRGGRMNATLRGMREPARVTTMAEVRPGLHLVRSCADSADQGVATAAPGADGADENRAGGLGGAWAFGGGDTAACGRAACAATDWPGRAWGVRAPGVDETALSPEEALMVLTGNPARGMGRLDLDPAFDHVDTMPRRVRVRPAGTWGIFSPGLRRAEPFDGLTA